MNAAQSENNKMTLSVDTISDVQTYGLDVKNRELYLHGYIGNTDEDPGVEYRMSNNFLKNIKLLEHMDSSKPITVHQHSIGGEWSEGMISETIAYRSINPELIYFDFVTRFKGVDPYELQENNLVKIDRKRIYHWQITDNKKKYFYEMDEITIYDDLGSENNSITGSGYCFLEELN